MSAEASQATPQATTPTNDEGSCQQQQDVQDLERPEGPEVLDGTALEQQPQLDGKAGELAAGQLSPQLGVVGGGTLWAHTASIQCAS